MSLLVKSFFTVGGVPKTGISPTVRIWEVDATSQTLIIGGPDPTMLEVGDGFYKYDFTVAATFDDEKEYVIRTDGGVALPPNERWHVDSYGPISAELVTTNINAIIDGVWDETATDHLAAGSTGLLLNQTAADAATTVVNTVTTISLIDELLKYERNRTKIDKINNELIIYENNGTTILKKFKLLDGSGNPSITEICERLPL